MNSPILRLIKTLKSEKPANVDNLVFKLHYKVTTMILIICITLVTSRQFFGQTISCIVNRSVPEQVQLIINAYCWINSTYTLSYTTNQKIGTHMAHPGVFSHIEGKHLVKYHTYYQWVTFVLMFQLSFFYLPFYLWKIWEGGHVENLVADMNSLVTEKQEAKVRIKMLLNYLNNNKNKHFSYLYHFLTCEILNLCNVIFQISLLDIFLNGEFTNYGFNLIAFMNDYFGQNTDPLNTLFPKLAKCTFRKFGPSGTLQNIDALCLLPLNIVNEKIYILLWFWYFGLAIITSIWLMFELAMLFIPRFRYSMLKAVARITPPQVVKSVVNNLSIGDWFFLYQLSKNLESSLLHKFIKNISEEMTQQRAN